MQSTWKARTRKRSAFRLRRKFSCVGLIEPPKFPLWLSGSSFERYIISLNTESGRHGEIDQESGRSPLKRSAGFPMGRIASGLVDKDGRDMDVEPPASHSKDANHDTSFLHKS